MDAEARMQSAPVTPRSALVASRTLLPELHRKKKKRKELSSYFSPHLEKIPHKYYFPSAGKKAGNLFRDNGVSAGWLGGWQEPVMMSFWLSF
jgi:hypothetical protein